MWLILSAGFALVGPRLSWNRLTRAVAGALTVAALLSLAFSISVRLTSADFVERASIELANRTSDGDVIGICNVPRTVPNLAPRGAFAVHDLLYRWSAEAAIDYYTGRRVDFVLHGPIWVERDCPDPEEVDVLVDFDELRADLRPPHQVDE